VHVPSKAADESFVRLNFAFQFFKASRLHGQPDPMKNKPRALLSYAKRPMQFPRTDSILAIRNHPNGRKPLVESERGILKDGPHLDGELFLASLAFPEATG
jgi:hypothetical protein